MPPTKRPQFPDLAAVTAMSPMARRRHVLAICKPFLAQHDMAAGTFGRLAMKDIFFLGRMRDRPDQVPQPKTVIRLQDFIANYKPQNDRCPTCTQYVPFALREKINNIKRNAVKPKRKG